MFGQRKKQCAILERSSEAVTFAVDDVALASEPLAEDTAAASWRAAVGREPIVLSDGEEQRVRDGGIGISNAGEVHPLLLAVHRAFAEHRPLRLTPDVVWLTIAQGFAQHVFNCGEALRERFVRHTGRRLLKQEVLRLKTLDDWAEAIEGFSNALAEEVGPGLRNLITCNFSTASPASRIASQIVFMGAMRRYVAYEMMCICGIPRITLCGTPSDWQAIEERTRVIAEYHLDWWTSALQPTLAEFTASVRGEPSKSFWQSIYKPKEAYGGDVITGWITDFFPYLVGDRNLPPSKRNPNLGIAPRKRKGLAPGRFPRGLTTVPLQVSEERESRAVDLVAGFSGVQQDPDLSLEPAIAWGVFEADALELVIQAIEKDEDRHRLASRGADMAQSHELYHWFDGLPPTLVAFYMRWNGGRMNAGTATETAFLPADEVVMATCDRLDGVGRIFARLVDGRVIACFRTWSYQDGTGNTFIVGRASQGEEATRFGFHAPVQTSRIADDMVEVGGDAIDLLRRISANSNRYWFDEKGGESPH